MSSSPSPFFLKILKTFDAVYLMPLRLPLKFLNNAGNQGFSVVHACCYGERTFVLMCRPFDQDVYDYHSQIDAVTKKSNWPQYRNYSGSPRSVQIVSMQLMRYCHCCGNELEKLINDNVNEFDILIEQQRTLLSGS